MSTYNARMAAKLGLKSPDTALVNQLLTLMARSGADWTNTFRALVHIPNTPSPAAAATSGNGSSSAASASSSSSTAGQEQEQAESFPSPGAAVAAAVSAGLPQQLVDACTADALAEEGPALVDEWVTWLRLWRARLAEEGTPEKVRCWLIFAQGQAAGA